MYLAQADRESMWKIFQESVSETKEKEYLSTFQRRAIIELIEKKIEIKDSYKTGDPFLS